MKTIELKKVKEDLTINNQLIKDYDVTTAELVKIAINYPVQGGYTVEDMVNRTRITSKLDEATKAEAEVLELEDADYTNLSTYVKAAKWSVISQTIIDFVQSFSK